MKQNEMNIHFITFKIDDKNFMYSWIEMIVNRPSIKPYFQVVRNVNTLTKINTI